jgi:Transposase DDE domain
LNAFFDEKNKCTKAAFCIARKKLKYVLFEDIFNKIVSLFYQFHTPNTFKGFLLWACDTTVQLLPDNEETQKIGIHKNQYKEVASVKISTYFDILNQIITSVALFDKRKSDLLCTIESQIARVPKHVIAIYDRAYGSQILAFFHDLYGSKYVIRLRVDFSNTVKNFIKTSDNEVIITECLTEKTYKRLEGFGIRKSKLDMITYRLVKVILPTGETEILMTNLGNDFTISDLSELYRLRWGVETCFNSIKNHQMLGTFSGYCETAVKQDIWCNLIFYNLQSISMLGAEVSLKALNEKRKKSPSKRKKKENQGYKLNRNVGTSTLRRYLPRLISPAYFSKIGFFLEEMRGYYLQSLELVKATQKERPRKLIRQNARHHTEKNYKRGF